MGNQQKHFQSSTRKIFKQPMKKSGLRKLGGADAGAGDGGGVGGVVGDGDADGDVGNPTNLIESD